MVNLLGIALVIGMIYAFVNLLPMQPPVKTFALCLVLLIGIVWLLCFAGMVPHAWIRS